MLINNGMVGLALVLVILATISELDMGKYRDSSFLAHFLMPLWG